VLVYISVCIARTHAFAHLFEDSLETDIIMLETDIVMLETDIIMSETDIIMLETDIIMIHCITHIKLIPKRVSCMLTAYSAARIDQHTLLFLRKRHFDDSVCHTHTKLRY